MDDQDFLIEVDDAEGHGSYRGVVETEDTEWLRDKLATAAGDGRVRILPDDADDTQGNLLQSTTTVRVVIEGDDDVEGHAISLHFPSRVEADEFRKRLLVTGALVGTVALGAVGGTALSALQEGGAGASLTSPANQGYTQRLDEMAATTQAGVAPNLGDASALDEMAAATQADPAHQGYTERLDEMAARTQAGPASSDAAGQADEGNEIGGPTPR